MAINITLTLGAGLGANLGPNFNLTADVGSVTPSTATKAELLAGKVVDVDNSASQVTVTSTGACTNVISQAIPCASTTTTTTTINPTNNLYFTSVAVSRDDVTSSNDGKYVAVICSTNNKLYISNDYGLTYRSVFVAAAANLIKRVAISGTGQYIYCTVQQSGQPSTIVRSTDYGVNWNATGGTGNGYSSITTNRTGQYVIVGSMNSGEAINEPYLNQVWRSSDYGVSFARVVFEIVGYPQMAYDVAIDSSGNRQYAASPNASIGPFDASVGKTTSASSIFTPKAIDENQTYFAVSTNADGSKVVVANQGGVYGFSPGAVQLKRSIDYGETYANFGGASTQWGDITIDGSGTNIIAMQFLTGTSRLYKSVSFGTLSPVTSSQLWNSVSISYNSFVAIASETTGLWRSTNSGSDWIKLP
jgi:hypothetical protein